MTTKAKAPPLAPFHRSIVLEMSRLRPNQKYGAANALGAARMIAITTCPKDRDFVQAALHDLLKRFGGMKSKKWTTADRATFNHAFRALARQDAEEDARVKAHANSAVVDASERGVGNQTNGAVHRSGGGEQNVGVHT